MNLSVTGKKMNTPIPAKKVPEISSPIKAPSKLATQKTAVQTKPKSNLNHNSKPTQVKKHEPLKIDLKKQTPKKIEEKVQKKEVPPQTQEKSESSTKVDESPKKQDIITQVTVRYNHYKEEFPCVNGVLSFLPIEQKYSFADVFKGKYLPVLKIFRSNDEIVPQTSGTAVEYSWKVQEGTQYRLEIREDEYQQAKVEKKAYKAPEKDNCPFKKNPRFDQLTEQMKKMNPGELGGAMHRELLEQRDLEDVLFS